MQFSLQVLNQMEELDRDLQHRAFVEDSPLQGAHAAQVVEMLKDIESQSREAAHQELVEATKQVQGQLEGAVLTIRRDHEQALEHIKAQFYDQLELHR